MTVHGEAAVLVLAAGAGTRMKSDTPKVLHTLAGRSMLSHALHAAAKVAPRHLVVVVGRGRERVAPAALEIGRDLGRPVEIAVQEEQRGTGHAVACGLSALPADFTGVVVVISGDVPLLDAETLADLIAAHSAESAVATVLTTTLADPTGYGRVLRTQDREVIGIVEQSRRHAGPSRRSREVNAGVYAFDAADAALGAEPASLRQRAARALPDRRHRDRPLRRAHRAGQTRRRQRRWSPVSTTASSWPNWAPSSTAASSPGISAPASRSSTPPPRGSTSTSPSAATPWCARAPSCWAPPASAGAARSAPTPR